MTVGRADPVAAAHREQDLAGLAARRAAAGPRGAGHVAAATAAGRRLGRLGLDRGSICRRSGLEVARLGVGDPLGGPVLDDPLVLGLGLGLRGRTGGGGRGDRRPRRRRAWPARAMARRATLEAVVRRMDVSSRWTVAWRSQPPWSWRAAYALGVVRCRQLRCVVRRRHPSLAVATRRLRRRSVAPPHPLHDPTRAWGPRTTGRMARPTSKGGHSTCVAVLIAILVLALVVIGGGVVAATAYQAGLPPRGRHGPPRRDRRRARSSSTAMAGVGLGFGSRLRLLRVLRVPVRPVPRVRTDPGHRRAASGRLGWAGSLATATARGSRGRTSASTTWHRESHGARTPPGVRRRHRGGVTRGALRCATDAHDPDRRGRTPHRGAGARLPRACRLRGASGRRRSDRPGRRAARSTRPGRAGPGPARARRPRRHPAAARRSGDRDRAHRHAHRPRRRAGQAARPRARRGRLPDQAVLAARARGPGPGGAAAGRSVERRRGDRGRRPTIVRGAETSCSTCRGCGPPGRARPST